MFVRPSPGFISILDVICFGCKRALMWAERTYLDEHGMASLFVYLFICLFIRLQQREGLQLQEACTV